MIFEILGPEGTSGLRLGMPRGEIRALLGEVREFQRTGTSPVSDQFLAAGVMVTYDADDRASLIEFADPAAPSLGGGPVLGMTVSQLHARLLAMGIEAVEEEDCVLVPSWRMSFYAPDDEVQGLLLGE